LGGGKHLGKSKKAQTKSLKTRENVIKKTLNPWNHHETGKTVIMTQKLKLRVKNEGESYQGRKKAKTIQGTAGVNNYGLRTFRKPLFPRKRPIKAGSVHVVRNHDLGRDGWISREKTRYNANCVGTLRSTWSRRKIRHTEEGAITRGKSPW